MLGTLFLTLAVFPLGPVLTAGLLRRKEMRPYTGVSVVLTILLAVLWFTNDHVSRIGLVSRVVQL
jgi:hypothetical protein